MDIDLKLALVAVTAALGVVATFLIYFCFGIIALIV